MPCRRTALLAPMLFALMACAPRTETDPDPTSSSAAVDLEDSEIAVPFARELLRAAETALTDRYGPLTWEDGDPERIAQDTAACSYASTVRRCDAYLGHDPGTPEEIAQLLGPVLTEHGFSALPVPVGSTGGWLTATASRGGLEFAFRAKGRTEIGVSGRVAAERCELPGHSDGG